MPQNNGRFDKLEVDNMDLIEFSGENRSLHLLPAKKAWWLKLFRKGLLRYEDSNSKYYPLTLSCQRIPWGAGSGKGK